MALRAGLREAGLHVVGLGGALEVFQVATDAGSVGAGQVVIVVDVTLHALHGRVRSRQRETRRRVIESCVIPAGRVVALGTGLREAGLYVVRLGGALEIFQVATDAGGIGAGQAVVAVHMALRALHGRVRSR